MNMNAVKLRPFVPSGSDYPLSVRFFEDLGFTKLYSDDGITIFRAGEVEFYLQNFHHTDMQNNYMLEVVVDSLDELWTQLQEAQLTSKYAIRMKEPTLFPWGKREIHLVDPAGVCWHFSEPKR
jgi:uncharacterized glyoxalase superfamily protein PhnB